MAKQKNLTYPKSIGAELWLHFILFIDALPYTGLIRTTVDELQAKSSIPMRELERALQKLTKHGFIAMRATKQNVLVIKLKHYGSLKTKRKKKLVAKQIHTP